MSDALVRLESVRAGTPEHPAIAGLSLSAWAGQTVVLSAARGHGLGLLPKLLLGQVAPLSGRIEVLGRDLAHLSATELRAHRSRCAAVVEKGLLLSNLSVSENVALPLRYHGVASEDEIARRLELAFDRHHLRQVADRRPSELTRAEQRWVAMVRADVSDARVVVVQEPFEGMDEVLCERVFGLLASWVGGARAVIVTTHSTSLATSYGGRFLRVPGGRIEQWSRGTLDVALPRS